MFDFQILKVDLKNQYSNNIVNLENTYFFKTFKIF